MSSLTSVSYVIDGENFEANVINRPHRDLATRDEELLSFIQSTSADGVYKGYNSRVSINCSAVASVSILENSSVSSDDGLAILTATSDLSLSPTSVGANALDAGSEASSTWYYIWMIRKSATGTEAGLLSISSTSPTLPTDYIYKRLVGAVRNDSGSDFVFFHQHNNQCTYYNDDLVLLATTSPSTTWANLDCSGFIPSGLNSRIAIIKTFMEVGSNGRRVWAWGTASGSAPATISGGNLVTSTSKLEDPSVQEFFQTIDSSGLFCYAAEYSSDWSVIHGYGFTFLVQGYIFPF